MRKELGPSYRVCGLDRERHDIRFAQFAKYRLDGTLIQPLGQTGHRLSADLVIDIREPSCKSIANGWRIRFRKGTKGERRPVSSATVFIGRKSDQRIDRDGIRAAAKRVRKSATNVFRRMACQSRKGPWTHRSRDGPMHTGRKR